MDNQDNNQNHSVNKDYREAKRRIRYRNEEIVYQQTLINSNDKQQKSQLRKDIKLINKLNSVPKGDRVIPNLEREIISVKNVSKFYTTKMNKVKVLESINLSIQRGDFVVILGPSGSGKTTLLNLIGGLDRATSGDIVINNQNLSALRDKELTMFRRYNVGFVFQSYNLLSSLNVTDNVEIGRTLQSDHRKRKDVKELLSNIDMKSQEKKRTYELSGGQQQRVSIARALAKSPDILIGDEPTGALDSKTSAKVFALFQEINRDQKTTVIIVTHNEAVAQLANKIIRLKDGLIDSITENKNPVNAAHLQRI